jgi:hypothetical protein
MIGAGMAFDFHIELVLEGEWIARHHCGLVIPVEAHGGWVFATREIG